MSASSSILLLISSSGNNARIISCDSESSSAQRHYPDLQSMNYGKSMNRGSSSADVGSYTSNPFHLPRNWAPSYIDSRAIVSARLRSSDLFIIVRLYCWIALHAVKRAMTATVNVPTAIIVVIIHFQSIGFHKCGLFTIYELPKLVSAASTRICPDVHAARIKPCRSNSDAAHEIVSSLIPAGQ